MRLDLGVEELLLPGLDGAREEQPHAGLAGGGNRPLGALLLVEAADPQQVVLLLGFEGKGVYAAGIPWYSTLFGRDSLITAIQTLSFAPEIAAETLRLLAGRLGVA